MPGAFENQDHKYVLLLLAVQGWSNEVGQNAQTHHSSLADHRSWLCPVLALWWSLIHLLFQLLYLPSEEVGL